MVMVDDAPKLIMESLKQIRDGVHQGFAEANRRLSKLKDHAIETNKRLATGESVVTQHGRVVDGAVSAPAR
jgi:hypothetical protein